MRTSILLALTLCILCSSCTIQSVSGGYVYQQLYATDYANTPSNFFCNGPTTSVSANRSAGVCQNNEVSGTETSDAYYCENSNYVIYITYNAANCSASSALTISRIPTKCGVASTSSSWKCTGTDTLPNGWSWPPANWLVATTQYNNTLVGSTGVSVPTCGSTGINLGVTSQVASNPACRNGVQTGPSSSPRRSTQTFAGSSSSNTYTAVYNDYDCLTPNLQSLAQNFAPDCKDGVTSSGITGGPEAPSAPVNDRTNHIEAKLTIYDSDVTCSGTVGSYHWYANSCFDSRLIQCLTNSTGGRFFRESVYGTASDGACTGSQVTGYPLDRVAGNCVAIVGQGYQYSCNVISSSSSSTASGISGSTSSSTGSDGPSSASTASFSFLSLTIAAIIALLTQ